jgi:hypothetical protein
MDSVEILTIFPNSAAGRAERQSIDTMDDSLYNE